MASSGHRPPFFRRKFPYSFFHATALLVAVNVAVFVLTSLLPGLMGCLGLNVVGCIGMKWWWQPFTYMFVHANMRHIFFNMLGLLMFGVSVERGLGSWEFLVLYLFCGVFDGLASLAVYFATGSYYVSLVGASGAVFSVILVYAVMYPKSILYFMGLIPIPAPLLVILYTVIELFGQLHGGSNVAHMTHLTGFVLAWLYLRVRMGVSPLRVWRDAWR